MEPDITDVAFHVKIEMETAKDRNTTRQCVNGNEDLRREPDRRKDNDTITKVLQKAPGLGESLREQQENLLAKGTLINYAAGQRRFREFCSREGHEANQMTEEMLIHYVGELNNNKTSYATLCQTKAALVPEEEMRTGKAVVS
jgi:hypothetical protein